MIEDFQPDGDARRYFGLFPAIVTDVVQPALARWADTVRELIPRARPADHAGLRWLPDGEADFDGEKAQAARCQRRDRRT